MKLPEKCRFLIFAFGIFVCYFLYGVAQDKISRSRYGNIKNEDGSIGERFTYGVSLVWVQCYFNFMFANGMMWLKPPAKQDTTEGGLYIVSALTNLSAMMMSNLALRWIPYPAQVVGIATKPIPIMFMGVLIGQKSYSWTRYGCVFAIVIGVILFMYNESKISNLPSEKMVLGEVLLYVSFWLDGLLGTVQERMRASSAPSGSQMMIAMNFWSSQIVTFALIATGEFIDFIRFANRNPTVWPNLLLLSLCGCLGQLFIFSMVAGYGPLACSVVTTTRKFFTVLFSVLLFGNVLIARQWLGALLVFSGLFIDMIFGKKRSQCQMGRNEVVENLKNE